MECGGNTQASSETSDANLKSISMSDERPLLVSASYDQSIRMWDVASGDQIVSLTHKEAQVNTMSLSPDGAQLFVGGWQHIKIYDLETSQVATFDSLSKNIVVIGFEERGKWLYSGGEDCTTKIWDFRCNLHCRRIFQVSASVSAVTIHPNQVMLIVADTSGSLYFWDLRRDTSETFATLGLDISEYVSHIDINKAGDSLVGVTNRGKVLVWGLGSLELEPTVNSIISLELKSRAAAHSKYGLKCHFSPDCSHFATTGADGYVHIWDYAANKPKPVKSLCVSDHDAKSNQAKWIWDCAYTCDSKYLFTASGQQLRLWDLESKEVVRYYQGHNKAITAMLFRENWRKAYKHS